MDINPVWLKRGFEVSDGMFAFIVIDVHADTIETFDSEAVRDLQTHEEWAEWVQDCLKNGGECTNANLMERLKEWCVFHPNFPIEQVLR
jgi:hypothetical protein